MKIEIRRFYLYPRGFNNTNAHPRIRIHFGKEIDFHFYNNRRKIITQLRKEILPATYSLIKFEGISMEVSEIKPYFCHKTGGGMGFPGFVLYNLPKFYRFLASIDVEFEGK